MDRGLFLKQDFTPIDAAMEDTGDFTTVESEDDADFELYGIEEEAAKDAVKADEAFVY